MPPRLIRTRTPVDPDAAVLVLHGGAARRERTMVSPAQLSVVRMIPVARRIARAGRGRLAVLRLLNSHRGWDSRTTPLTDVAWALERVHESLGDVPIALVGHSLGGRAALLAGDQAPVRCVVALNPWVQASDQVDLRERRALVVHGLDDTIALPDRSLALARRLAVTARVGYIAVPGGRHAMVRHGRRFEAYAAEFVAATLLGDEPDSPAVAAILGGAFHAEG